RPGVTTSIRVPSSDYPTATSRALAVNIGAAELTLSDETTDSSLLELTAEHPEGSGQPTIRDRLEGSRVLLDVTAEQPRAPFALAGRRTYRLALGQPELPTAVDLSLGAGKADVHLGQIHLEALSLDLGAGSATLSFAGSSLPPRLTVDVGAGQATIKLPRTATLRIQHDIGAGRLTVDGKRLGRDGQYVAEGSGPTVELVADVGAGSLVIERT